MTATSDLIRQCMLLKLDRQIPLRLPLLSSEERALFAEVLKDYQISCTPDVSQLLEFQFPQLFQTTTERREGTDELADSPVIERLERLTDSAASVAVVAEDTTTRWIDQVNGVIANAERR